MDNEVVKDSQVEEDDALSNGEASKEKMDEPNEEIYSEKNEEPPRKKKRIREKTPEWNKKVPEDERFVDWGSLSQERWGKESLLRYIPGIEVDSLIGWATNINSHRTSTTPHCPLEGLASDPLRPSLLDWMEEVAYEVVRKSNSKLDSLYGAFDLTALEALGFISEEMITASLMPLARDHVRRCRRLEDEGHMDQAFQEWTLPPEEALYNILKSTNEEPHGGLPTSTPPSRSSVPGAPSTSAISLSSRQKLESDAIKAWCKAVGLREDFVRDNADLLGILIPSLCPPQPPVVTSNNSSATTQATSTAQVAATANVADTGPPPPQEPILDKPSNAAEV